MTGNPPLSSGWLQLKTTLSHVGSPVKSLGLLGAAVEYEQSKRFKTCIFFFLDKIPFWILPNRRFGN